MRKTDAGIIYVEPILLSSRRSCENIQRNRAVLLLFSPLDKHSHAPTHTQRGKCHRGKHTCTYDTHTFPQRVPTRRIVRFPPPRNDRSEVSSCVSWLEPSMTRWQSRTHARSRAHTYRVRCTFGPATNDVHYFLVIGQLSAVDDDFQDSNTHT